MAKKKAVKKAAPKAKLTPFKQAVIDYAIGVTRAFQNKWFKGLEAKLKKLEKTGPDMLALAGHFRKKHYSCRDRHVKELTSLIIRVCGVKTPIPSGEMGYPHRDMDGEMPFLGVIVPTVKRDNYPAPAGKPLLCLHAGGNFTRMLNDRGRTTLMSEYQDHMRPATDDEIRKLISKIPAKSMESKLGHLGAFFKNVTNKAGTFSTGGGGKAQTKKRPAKKKRATRRR